MIKEVVYLSLMVIVVLIVPNNTLGQDRQVSLKEFLELAKKANSSSLVLMHNGDFIAEEHFDKDPGLIETMSVTKLVVSLGIGRLYALNLIDSIDQKVHNFYPEWHQGRKKDITIRHLMEHTSGLQNEMDARVEIHPSPDVVQLALAAELSGTPGEEIRYNNKAVNLLAGIIQKASGMKMDKFVEKELFKYLNIYEFEWRRDNSGNPYAMSGLQMYGKDVAKLGQLVLNRGEWNGQKIIDQEYIAELKGNESDKEFGLLWRKLYSDITFSISNERINYLIDKGVPDEIINNLRNYVGITIEGQQEVEAILFEIFGSPQRFHEEIVGRGIENLFDAVFGEINGYYGDGDLGQYLIVMPEKELVVVRQIKYSNSYNPKTDTFREILQVVNHLEL
jgi:CubicO group peptidase (beta-lactamase class C family)